MNEKFEIAKRGLQIGEKLRRSSRHDKPSFQVNYVLDSDEDCGGDECDDNALVGRGHISVTQTAVEEEVDGKYFMKGKYVNQIFSLSVMRRFVIAVFAVPVVALQTQQNENQQQQQRRLPSNPGEIHEC